MIPGHASRPVRTLKRAASRIGVLAALVWLSACVSAAETDYSWLKTPVAPADFTCCANPERMPKAIADTAVDLSPVFSPLVSGTPMRPGYISAAPDAWSYLVDQARPLDIMLTSGKNWIPGQVVLGRFTHATIYLGSEAQLRALGIWDAPEVVPHHADIRAGRIILEGVSGGAKLNDPEGIFNADGALLVRPALANAAARRKAALRLFARLGVPFDYAFDVSSCDKLACTEMLAQSMPQIGFVVRPVFGTPMLIPDDIAAQAIRGENLAVIAYARGLSTGWTKGSLRALMTDIRLSWGPVPVDLSPVALQRTADSGLGGVCTPAAPQG